MDKTLCIILEMKMSFQPVIFVLLTWAGSSLGAADTVTLVNGNKITGVISEETPTKVSLNKRGLVLTLDRTDISGIERMNPEVRKKALEELQAPRPHQESYFPEPARPLFYAVEDLDALKAQWVKERDQTQALEEKVAAEKTEALRLDRLIIAGRRQLDASSLNFDRSTPANTARIKAHNRLVNQTNQYIDQLRRVYSRIDQLEQQMDASYQRVRTSRKVYVRNARRLGINWILFEKSLDPDESLQSDWFAELNRRVKTHPAAYLAGNVHEEPPFVLNAEGHKIYTLPPAGDGHFYLTATLNQIQVEDFLIDTGATFSLVPESIGKAAGARRVGPPVITKVADGRTVDIYPAVVEELEIYGQRFRNVRVGLIADQNPDNITNLLGMDVISQIPMTLTPDGLVITIKPDNE